MRILRVTCLGVTCVGLLASLAVAPDRLVTPIEGAVQAQTRAAGTSAMTMSREQKVANAMTAAPQSIAAAATILDWPAVMGDRPSTLRAGTNGWNCLPDDPTTEGNDPMCIDAAWMQWMEAFMAKTDPKVPNVAFGYMMAPGGSWGSNIDPVATGKTATNQWHLHPPHVMVVVPDIRALDGLPTDPASGGPYVMWKGTPYTHVMAPVSAMDHSMMK